MSRNVAVMARTKYRSNANRRLVSGGLLDRPAPIDDNPAALGWVDPNADDRAQCQAVEHVRGNGLPDLDRVRGPREIPDRSLGRRLHAHSQTTISALVLAIMAFSSSCSV